MCGFYIFQIFKIKIFLYFQEDGDTSVGPVYLTSPDMVEQTVTIVTPIRYLAMDIQVCMILFYTVKPQLMEYLFIQIFAL